MGPEKVDRRVRARIGDSVWDLAAARAGGWWVRAGGLWTRSSGTHSYLRASTGSSWAARVAGTVPKTMPTAAAAARAMKTESQEKGRL